MQPPTAAAAGNHCRNPYIPFAPSLHSQPPLLAVQLTRKLPTVCKTSSLFKLNPQLRSHCASIPDYAHILSTLPGIFDASVQISMDTVTSSTQLSLFNRNILLGATGSVAAIRVPKLVNLLKAAGANVQVVITKSAAVFLNAEQSMPDDIIVHTDEAEWHQWKSKGDPVLHIELRKWADFFLIAPLSANSLAKLAVGICDNLLLSVARAWRFRGDGAKPIFIAPAMNSEMWAHPVSDTQIQTVQGWGIQIIMPVRKTLACGDFGVGAMEEPEKIVKAVTNALSEST